MYQFLIAPFTGLFVHDCGEVFFHSQGRIFRKNAGHWPEDSNICDNCDEIGHAAEVCLNQR